MQALDALAQELPSSQVFPPALAYAQAYIGSGDAEERRSACDVMVVVAEGCSKLVRKHLPAVLQVPPPSPRAYSQFSSLPCVFHSLLYNSLFSTSESFTREPSDEK